MIPLLEPQPTGHPGIRLRAGTMLYRFKHQILGPLVILWLVLTVASVIKLATVWTDMSKSLQASTEATAISDSLEELFITVQEAESAQRGYMLTGIDSYLDPFKRAEDVMPATFSRLAALMATDHNLQVDLLELKGRVEVKMNEMRESIKIRRDKGLSSALSFIANSNGQEMMDGIRRVERKMREQRVSLVSSAGETMRQHFEQGQTFGLITGVIGVGAGLFALYLFSESYRQMKAQRELLIEKLRAEETVVEKSAFLANMSHEIRTPMNAILGFGELLEQEPLTQRQAQYARSIRQSGKSLLQLINDVLDLSKMEAGKMELFLEPTDVREVCGFMQTMFAQQAVAKSLRQGLELGSVPRSLLLDRLRLRQLLVNLVGNAIKFTEQGSVTVRVNWLPNEHDKSRGTLTIDVSDTGVGISPEKKEEIFKPFVQSEPGRAAENQGSGLGLSIVQRLLAMMDGTITLESAVGHGSVFHLKLPNIAVSARLPLGDVTEEDRAVNFNDFKPSILLVVDDNETNRRLVAGIFERTHHQLMAATNGREALEHIAKQQPDVVLMDLRMPVMDGRAALAEIRKQPGLELLPVIAVTASSEATDEKELRHRFNGFLRKPFSRALLYKELAGFLPRIAGKAGPPAGSLPEPPPAGPGATAKKAADWQAVSTELRTLRANEWPGLRETLAIRDSQAFAQKLRSLAQANQCAPLAAYADELTTHAEMFAVAELEKHLAGFPELVDTIQRNTAG